MNRITRELGKEQAEYYTKGMPTTALGYTGSPRGWAASWLETAAVVRRRIGTTTDRVFRATYIRVHRDMLETSRSQLRWAKHLR